MTGDVCFMFPVKALFYLLSMGYWTVTNDSSEGKKMSGSLVIIFISNKNSTVNIFSVPKIILVE